MSTVNNSNPWLKLSPVLRFLIVFVLIVFCFYFFLWGSEAFHNTFVQSVVKTNAFLGSKLLNIFGMGTQVQGSQIFNERFIVTVKTGCDGLEGMIIFAAAVLGFPAAKMGKKMKGLLWGIGVLFLVNIIRIMVLFLSGVYFKSLFDIIHDNIGQIVFILIALILFGIWLAGLQKNNQNNEVVA